MRTAVWLMGMLAISPAWAEAPLALRYGVNEVDINGDGILDIIFKSRWDVFNAHSADRYVVTVKMRPEGQPDGEMAYFEVGFFDDPRKALMTLEGADCVLRDYVFSTAKHAWLTLKTYERQGAFYEERPVAITEYRLVRSEDTMSDGKGRGPGMTAYAFKEVKKHVTKEKHCDVRDAVK